jgi:hypothetical protein
MANKVASKRWIYSNFSVGSSSNECATKTEILGFGLYITNDSSYASNQLVREEDIYLPAWTYSFSVSNWDKNVGESGGTTSSISISSTKSRLGTTESVGWSIDSSTVPSWVTWNSSDMTFTVASNSSTSSRTADIYFEQDESGKRDYARVTQAEATPTTTYTFSVNPYKVNVGSSGGSGSVTITSYKTVGYNTYDVDYSIDSSTLPSWASFNKSTSTFTIQSTTSTVGRTARVYFDQDESGKRDYAEITQTGYTPPVDTYVFTWFDGSTSDINANFPWDPSTNGAAANIPLVSTKNGSSQSWSVSSEPSWIVTSTTSSKVIINVSDNSGSARSGEIVLTQDGSGKTLTVNVSQDAKPAEDEYTFEIRKSDEEYTGKTSITFDVPASTVGWSGNYAYRSRKNGEQFANVSFSSSASWLHVESSGAYTVDHNTGSSSRSGTITLTQAESGLKCYVYINQSGYTPTYTFNVSPTNLSVTAAETNETLTVNSYKTVLKSDGSETTESLDYEFSSDTSWVNAARTTTNTTYITVAENLTVAKRNAKITLTQAESGAQAFTNVTQAGKVQSSNKLTITSITYDEAYLFPPGVTPVVGSTMYLKFLIPNTFTWETSSGLTMNRGTAYAGDTCNIYVFENSRYRLVRSFTLQTGEQTIAI